MEITSNMMGLCSANKWDFFIIGIIMFWDINQHWFSFLGLTASYNWQVRDFPLLRIDLNSGFLYSFYQDASRGKHENTVFLNH